LFNPDIFSAHTFSEKGPKARRIDKAAQRQVQIEESGDIGTRQGHNPALQPVQISGGIGGTDDGTDRATAYQIRFYADFGQGAQDADM
jgi:hypothetical protein